MTINKLDIFIHSKTKFDLIINYCGNQFGIPHLKYYCPVCEKKVFRWMQFRRNIGNGKMSIEPKRRLCPHCKSFERTRHFQIYLEKMKILDSKPKFLHFAPERGLEKKLRMILNKNYITTDLLRNDVDYIEDITKMTFEDNSFDFIFCSNVLEHVENDIAAMKELIRILTPGGTAIIQVPMKGNTTYEDPSIVDPEERAVHFGQADHLRFYGRDISQKLSNVGFIVEEFIMNDILKISPQEIIRMNLNTRGIIHKITKN